MSRWLLTLMVFILSGCVQSGAGANFPPQAGKAPAPTTVSPASSAAPRLPSKADLSDYGPAPELTNTVWLNTDRPLRLADLRGKVVLLEMWTFDCINCRHVIPSLSEWHHTYASQGLVIIGNHFPEFEFERGLDSLKEAVKSLEVSYPVAQDNDGATWRAYDNHYWPSLYLIDKTGEIRYKHIGEGAYPETEAVIQALLAEEVPAGE